jgi:hypothetical protein
MTDNTGDTPLAPALPVDAPFADILEAWKVGLCQEVDLAALYNRSDVAHRWKAPFRSLILREGLCWRIVDLLDASHELTARGKSWVRSSC